LILHGGRIVHGFAIDGLSAIRYSDQTVAALRARVRLVAVVWLLCQAGSLAAFGPNRCCISHTEQAKTDGEPCHETEPPPPQQDEPCAMHQGDGSACPMKGSRSDDCTMRTGCNGPGQQLAQLLTYLATPEAPAVPSTELASSATLDAAPPPLLHRFPRPDAPPPKA